MNLLQLSKRVGSSFRLRPQPHRVDGNGARLPTTDDHWRLEGIRDNPTRLQLRNVATGHVLDLQPDNVKEYRSPDFLILRCQVTVRPRSIGIEPLVQDSVSLVGAPLDLEDALSALDQAPLLARDSARAQLVGARVRCRGTLGSLKAVAPDRLKVGIIMHSDDVYFEVPKKSYPWLLTATDGIPIQAEGTLARFHIGVWLEDATIIAVK